MVIYAIQMEDVYEITYDTCGQYWPNIHHYIFLSVALMQITMIGLFGQVKARSFLRHNSLACVEHSFQWVLQGPISSNFQPSTSPGTLIPSLKHIVLALLFLLCSSFIRSGASTKHDSQIVITLWSLLDILIRLPNRVMSLMRLRVWLNAMWTMQFALIGHHGCVRQTWNLVLCSLWMFDLFCTIAPCTSNTGADVSFVV